MNKEQDYITKQSNKIFAWVGGTIVSIVAAQVAFNYNQEIIGFACLVGAVGSAAAFWVELTKS